MDFLNFVIALHAGLKAAVPEADYPNLVRWTPRSSTSRSVWASRER
jgi:hypothetical protein